MTKWKMSDALVNEWIGDTQGDSDHIETLERFRQGKATTSDLEKLLFLYELDNNQTILLTRIKDNPPPPAEKENK